MILETYLSYNICYDEYIRKKMGEGPTTCAIAGSKDDTLSVMAFYCFCPFFKNKSNGPPKNQYVHVLNHVILPMFGVDPNHSR